MSGIGEVFEIESRKRLWSENLCFTGEQVFMLSDRQEAIAFCSKPQDKTNGLSNLLRATKRPRRSEHRYVAARSQRPSCSVGTLVRQAVEPGSAQWDQEAEKKNLKAMRMDLERIRNLMSEVISLWPWGESLRGCKVRNLPFQCPKKKKVQPSVQSGALCVAGSALTQNNTELAERHHSVHVTA